MDKFIKIGKKLELVLLIDDVICNCGKIIYEISLEIA